MSKAVNLSTWDSSQNRGAYRYSWEWGMPGRPTIKEGHGLVLVPAG